MRSTKILAGAAFAGLAAAAWLLPAGSRGAEGSGPGEKVSQLATALKDGNQEQAKALTNEVAKSFGAEEVMKLFNLRSKKGLGVGSRAGEVSPDGIEKMVIELSGKTKSQSEVDKQAAALEKMGYDIAAIAAVAKALTPDKDEGKKKKADWESWSAEMQKLGLDLAAAAKAKDPGAINKAGSNLDQICLKCHDVWR